MVCLGNICRSPMAEGIMRAAIKREALNWQVDSAGTNGYHSGEPPHPHAVKICKVHGIDISEQRAKIFTGNLFNHYDMIYAFAEDVHCDIIYLSGGLLKPEKLDYFLNPLYGRKLSVPDPWYGDESGYQPVFDLISQGAEAIIDSLKNRYV